MLLGIFVNLGLALIKCVAGLLGDSFALVADGWNPSWMSIVLTIWRRLEANQCAFRDCARLIKFCGRT